MARLIVDAPVFLRLAPRFGLGEAQLSRDCGINLLSWGRPRNVIVAIPVLGGINPLCRVRGDLCLRLASSSSLDVPRCAQVGAVQRFRAPRQSQLQADPEDATGQQ